MHLLKPTVVLAAGLVGLACTSTSGALSNPRPLPQSGTDATNFVPSGAASGGICYAPKSCYNYVNDYADQANEGARDRLKVAEPRLGPNAYHSLEEIAVESADEKQIVEIGWISERSPGARAERVPPRLFVFHWINGNGTCYSAPGNWCGFVSTSKTVMPMMTLKPGSDPEFAIHYQNGRWYTLYKGKSFGYFPGSQWNGTYTRAGFIQTFGEIAATSVTTCTQMGNGLGPSNPKASAITAIHLYGTNATPEQLSATQPKAWNFKTISNGFRLGGNGDCSTT